MTSQLSIMIFLECLMDWIQFDPHNLWYALAVLLMLVGLAGTVLPVLPGVPLLFAGMLWVAWLGDFAYISGWVMLVLGLLTIVAMVADFAASVLGAKHLGASKQAIIGASVGTLVGFFFGIPGLILGPFVGAMVGEWLHMQDIGQASKVGVGTWIGLLLGTALKIALAFTMLAIFLLAVVV